MQRKVSYECNERRKVSYDAMKDIAFVRKSEMITFFTGSVHSVH